MKLRIKELRAGQNMSQAELANKLTFADASILSKIEIGNRKLNVEEAAEIASVFGVSVDYLLGLTDRTLSEEKRMLSLFKAVQRFDDTIMNEE